MKTVRRVLFVNPGRDLGGAEQSLLLLLQGLRQAGVEPTVAVFGDGPFRAALERVDIPTVTLGLPDRLRQTSRYALPERFADVGALALRGVPAALRLAALARRLQADLLHSNGLKAHLIAGVAGGVARRPVVWHLRDFPPDGPTGRLFRSAARHLPSLVLTNSEAVATELRSTLNGSPPVVAVHNPVDLERFRPAPAAGPVRAELGIAAESPLVGMVAHLTPWKGHEDFLRVARRVLDAVPEAHFVIAGGPIYETAGHAGYEASLRRQVSDLELGLRVLFLGARDDVPDVLAALDVLVHCPTAPEPFGRALAEAMAVARPVVATDGGGIPEIVREGETGYLVRSRDTLEFADRVVRLLRDPALRARLGAAGRNRAEVLFGVETHTRRVLEAYASLA